MAKPIVILYDSGGQIVGVAQGKPLPTWFVVLRSVSGPPAPGPVDLHQDVNSAIALAAARQHVIESNVLSDDVKAQALALLAYSPTPPEVVYHSAQFIGEYPLLVDNPLGLVAGGLGPKPVLPVFNDPEFCRLVKPL